MPESAMLGRGMIGLDISAHLFEPSGRQLTDT